MSHLVTLSLKTSSSYSIEWVKHKDRNEFTFQMTTVRSDLANFATSANC